MLYFLFSDNRGILALPSTTILAEIATLFDGPMKYGPKTASGARRGRPRGGKFGGRFSSSPMPVVAEAPFDPLLSAICAAETHDGGCALFARSNTVAKKTCPFNVDVEMDPTHVQPNIFSCPPMGTAFYRSLPVPRRHTPYFGQPDYRIYELNKRLQQRTEESDNLWWDAFATEFFEDDASLTLAFCLEDGPKRYTIGRTLIPRYFRSIFEGGVTELYYNMKHPKESFHNTSITLDCDQCTMVTHHGKPWQTKVCTEGRLILEFTFDDLMRIKSWHFTIRTHRELIPRSVVGVHSQQDPNMLEQLSKNITRQGITNSTLNYLRLCVILEPMQELMSRHKAYALSPRDCLKTTLFQKWQRMCAPPGKRESQRPANKRRKRKGSNSGGAANNSAPTPNKKRSPGPNFSLASQDVMVVGEPSLMGGEFGDEDERLITRLENTQYDAANSLEHDNHGFHADSPMPGSNSWGASVGDRGGPPQGTTPNQDSDKKSPAVSQ
ncbi:LIM domain-binding protein 2 isoform X7 [Coccinella septempunctata]|uniref:LIM domain-binding protein 2 isoform X7 n=1 Tax=Coccinella septempunctata TaxID=41139 RepID=UPI001D06262D|nr:LIM domain-binding protein 2 isoform X7 [Coccinella septempunctata]